MALTSKLYQLAWPTVICLHTKAPQDMARSYQTCGWEPSYPELLNGFVHSTIEQLYHPHHSMPALG